MTDVILRDARRGPADEAVVTWDLETATDQMYSIKLGSRWEATLRAVVAQPGHAWSVERARIAEIDGSMAGVLLGAPAATPMPEGSLGLAWGWTRLRLWAVSLSGRAFLNFMSKHGPGEWYITAVAVTPEARGKGVGAVLLEDAITRARDAGATSVTLDVDDKNVGAQRLYERYGFEVTGASPPARLWRGVRVFRMRLALASDTDQPSD
jgi:ribosomal protein S18 acetylase RimI-like enzyme